MFTLLILLKTFKFFLMNSALFSPRWRNFPRLSCRFSYLTPYSLTVSSLCVSYRSVQTLADKSKQEALRNDLVDALKRKQNCQRCYCCFFLLSLSLSLSLSCARLISAIFFSVSLRLPLHACFSAALVYLWKKQKMRKCLAFYLFFCFVNCFLSGFLFSCISSAMKPFTHAPSVSHPSLLSSFPRYRYYDSITTVNDNITV